MVFIRDLKREFFEFISKQQRRLLVFVHLDVDSLCAWKIFQHLLQCEHITYTCLPVLYKYDLENGHMQHINSGIKSIVFILFFILQFLNILIIILWSGVYIFFMNNDQLTLLICIFSCCDCIVY